jgi:hypothetical protein
MLWWEVSFSKGSAPGYEVMTAFYFPLLFSCVPALFWRRASGLSRLAALFSSLLFGSSDRGVYMASSSSFSQSGRRRPSVCPVN